MQIQLPNTEQKTLACAHFPTAMQAFIFRNWPMVSQERLAQVLGTSAEKVACEARRMGLGEQGDTSVWLEKGYITILRANWHLLPYEQLLLLLGWSPEKLAYILKEEDFLDVKMGNFKPACTAVTYQELTAEQKQQTEKIKREMEHLAGITPADTKKPFDFQFQNRQAPPKSFPAEEDVVVNDQWYIQDKTGSEIVEKMAQRFVSEVKQTWNVSLNGDKSPIVLAFGAGCEAEYHEISIQKDSIVITAGSDSGILRGLYRLENLAHAAGGFFFQPACCKRQPRFGSRFIYSFCGLYERALDVDSRTYCPDSLLEEYAKIGVNGIWLQAILYRLVEFPYAPQLSEGWENRLAHLADFVNRAKLYGIKIYLYINEPRTMPLSFFEQYPHMKGAVKGANACLCLSAPETEQYLDNAVKNLCRAVPDLGGFFTITMSENLTHCKSRETDIPCPHCADTQPWELVSRVNRIIADAAHQINPDILVMAWDWAWTSDRGFKPGDVEKCIEALPQDVAVMCKRETALPYTRGGITGAVRDYSLSVDGISEESIKTWTCAKKYGHATVAKLQINNTWECSTTPYLPVFRTLFRQIGSLIEKNVTHLMLSWTLGGYPSPNIRLISEAFFIENGDTGLDFDRALQNVYGPKAERIKKATDLFCKAFSEFPFDLDVLYYGPQNSGVSNLLYREPTGFEATMTCYAYDDLEKWRSIYPAEIFEQQFRIVSETWQEGLALLEDEQDEFFDIAYFSYSLFRSSYHQIRFIRLRELYRRRQSEALRRELVALLTAEKQLAAKVYPIMCRRPEIGFEAANHYYFTANHLCEKMINCNWLIEFYESLKE